MSWNGRDINYPVSPGVMHRNIQSLINVPKVLDEIYKEVNEGKGLRVIEINPKVYSSLPHSWTKSGRLFGLAVKLADVKKYRIKKLRSRTELNYVL